MNRLNEDFTSFKILICGEEKKNLTILVDKKKQTLKVATLCVSISGFGDRLQFYSCFSKGTIDWQSALEVHKIIREKLQSFGLLRFPSTVIF